MEEEFLGIDKEKAHQRAIELMTEDFFWSGSDELAPFGSDEGYTALAAFRRWRKKYPEAMGGHYITWVIESVGELKNYRKYDDEILDRALIKKQKDDPDFDDQQYIYTLDISIIATGFGQLVDEGKIDEKYKVYIQRAIDRQKIWADLSETWEYKDEYIRRMNVMEGILEEA